MAHFSLATIVLVVFSSFCLRYSPTHSLASEMNRPCARMRQETGLTAFPLTTKSYEEVKLSCEQNRAVLAERYKASGSSEKEKLLDSAGQILEQLLVSQIIPFWYGTKWDFNGYTATPRQGVIACGYFVSTTLLHAGINVNRYRLAQQNPVNEALSLHLSDSILVLENLPVEAIEQYLSRDLKDGLYFVGLDFHVGFLLKNQEGLFFIHSNYIGAEGVLKEPTKESQAFSSTHYYIAELTTNREFVRRWLLKETIGVRTDGVMR